MAMSPEPTHAPISSPSPFPGLSPRLRTHLRSARELIRERSATSPAPPLSTGIAALDHLLRGGLPRGEMAELVGRPSSGRFALALAVLAAATGAGETSALVDLGDGLEPERAAAAGVDLERLLWLRPQRLREALAGTEMLLASGIPLVVLDLGAPPIPGGRGAEASWLRLARAVGSQRTALLVVSPYRVTGTAARTVLGSRKRGPIWYGRGRSPRLLTAVSCQITLEKSRCQRSGGQAILRLSLPGARIVGVESSGYGKGDGAARRAVGRRMAGVNRG